MRGLGFYQVVFFFPQVLSVAIIAVLCSRCYVDRTRRSAMLNGAAGRSVGRARPAGSWPTGDLALWCVMAVIVWGSVGFYVVLFSAAMESIPKDIYEAALLDGAGPAVTTFFRITLPLLWDTVQAGWVYLGILALDVLRPGRRS